MIQIVPVDRTEILEVEGLEQHTRGDECFKGFLRALGKLVDVVADFWQGFQKQTKILA